MQNILSLSPVFLLVQRALADRMMELSNDFYFQICNTLIVTRAHALNDIDMHLRWISLT